MSHLHERFDIRHGLGVSHAIYIFIFDRKIYMYKDRHR